MYPNPSLITFLLIPFVLLWPSIVRTAVMLKLAELTTHENLKSLFNPIILLVNEVIVTTGASVIIKRIRIIKEQEATVK